MLKNDIVKDDLFSELSTMGNSLDIFVVDVVKTVHGTDVHISVVIQPKKGEAGIESCELFHRTIQPRLELMFGRDNLSMEVSTPGLQRAFRDCYEFTVFIGKQVRLYSLDLSSWVNGTIKETGDDFVVLSDVLIEDGNRTADEYKEEYVNIQKAKLDFSFSTAKEKK